MAEWEEGNIEKHTGGGSVTVCVALLLLDSGSVNTLPNQQRIVVGVVFCEVRGVSKDK
jgi:hypothetical protein